MLDRVVVDVGDDGQVVLDGGPDGEGRHGAHSLRWGWFNERVPEPAEIAPDTKDWTWVLDRRCPECGFDSADLALSDLPELLRTTALAYGDVLRDHAAARHRPDPGIWSPLEYACHVRDVHRVFAERLTRMLAEDDPRSRTGTRTPPRWWDGYAEQDPAGGRPRAGARPPAPRPVSTRASPRTRPPGPGAQQRQSVHRAHPGPLPPARRGAPPARPRVPACAAHRVLGPDGRRARRRRPAPGRRSR